MKNKLKALNYESQSHLYSTKVEIFRKILIFDILQKYLLISEDMYAFDQLSCKFTRYFAIPFAGKISKKSSGRGLLMVYKECFSAFLFLIARSIDKELVLSFSPDTFPTYLRLQA